MKKEAAHPLSLRSRRAQTLVEALVALGLVTTGMLGVIALLNRSFVLNRTVADNTEATYLAAEGIEIAKNVIDYDVYYGFGQSGADDWGCSFQLNAGATADYELDYTTVPPATCGKLAPAANQAAAQSAPLYFNAGTDMYSYHAAGATASKFSRDVRITNSANGQSFDVVSKVLWTSGVTQNSVTLEDHFYHWHP